MYPDTSYVIGSDPAVCDIVFHDVSVSRQHARISVNPDNSMIVEDLGSSNGTLIESKKIEGKQIFSPNTLVSVGTTSFIVYDREGERTTIVSPLLPQIVKILQQQEGEAPEKQSEKTSQGEEKPQEQALPASKTPQNLGSFIFVSILTGVFIIVGIATLFLFQPQNIQEKEQINPKKTLETTLEAYPSIRWNFNPTTGRLLLVGHVLTPVDRNQVIYNVKALPFVKEVDDNIIVDELIWKEQNQIIDKNPNWKGVTIYAPSPGKFVISGYIKTSEEAEALNDYLAKNFPYLDLLQQKIVVEENLLNRISIMLKDKGYNAVKVKISSNGEAVLSGNISAGEKANFEKLETEMKKINGIRDIRAYITELPPAETMVDLTGQYTVSGSATQPNGQITVIINGKFLTVGDVLDGKKITRIDDNTIMLEGGGIKYKIEYNR